MKSAYLLMFVILVSVCRPSEEYDLIIRNGMIYDGRGGAPFRGEVAVNGDTIALLAPVIEATAEVEFNAGGLAVVPGFINMLSWASETLIIDGRSQSDIRQGVTLEVMGEGWSYGPWNEAMVEVEKESQADYKYEITWRTLGEYLDALAAKGVSTNVASFVGATTIRIHELGYEDRAPTAAELERMQQLVEQAMEEGALGLSTALIYAPAFYAESEELIELAKVAAKHGGIYISHIRSEGSRLLESIDELIAIAKAAEIPAEIYHLKAAGKANWDKLDAAIEKIEAARSRDLQITADMYTYTAGSTGLDAAMPPWVQEGGYRAWAQRLQDPAIRAKVAQEMTAATDEWENFYHASGPDKIILVGFKSEEFKPLTGKTLQEVADMRQQSPPETAMDLVIEDNSRVECVYFLMSEENVRKQIALPWMSFCSDGGSYSTEGVFLRSQPHPRAYGNFARLLGKYVREEKMIPLAEAIRRLTSLPASNLGIRKRGQLRAGYFADLVIFDPETIQDHATYENPHQYATGVKHVFVNGVQVLKDGEHTGETPGRVVRGSGLEGNGMNHDYSDRYVETNGVRLHVVTAGPPSGRLLIFLHGFPEFWYGWRHQIGFFAERGFRVWAPDQRGYHLSDKPKGVSAYRLDALAHDVLGLIESAGADKAFVAGHDWGGVVAWWLALKWPQLVERLAILNVPHPAVMRSNLLKNRKQLKKSWYVFFFQLPWLPERYLRRNDFRLSERALVKTSRPGTFSPDDLAHYRQAWAMPGALTGMINWYRAAMQRLPGLPSQPEIKVPVLILWGKQDRFLGAEMARQSLEFCQNGRLVFFEEASHWIQHEEKDKVNQLLLEFFA